MPGLSDTTPATFVSYAEVNAGTWFVLSASSTTTIPAESFCDDGTHSATSW